MGYAVGPRGGKWTAMYRNAEGKRVSAGQYLSEEEALRVARAKEEWIKGGGGMDPELAATITIADFVPVFYRLKRTISPSTKANYNSTITCHILPRLGKVRVKELTRHQVRNWLADLEDDGVEAPTLRRCRMVLSSMMKLAVSDDIRDDNPCYNIPDLRIRKKKYRMMTVPEFQRLVAALPTQAAKVMAQLHVSTGIRLGEVQALEVGDLDFERLELSITKALADVGGEFHPDGERFMVNPHDKTYHDERVLPVHQAVATLVEKYIADNGLLPGELLFPMRLVRPQGGPFPRSKNRAPLTDELIATLGTHVGPNGITYQHGTVNCYVTGKCKCDYCKQASSEYSVRKRAERRKSKKQVHPSGGKLLNVTGHLDRGAWADIWYKAVEDAGLEFRPLPKHLRHTNASWLDKSGMNRTQLQSHLGHSSGKTTEGYIHQPIDRTAADLIEAMGIGMQLPPPPAFPPPPPPPSARPAIVTSHR